MCYNMEIIWLYHIRFFRKQRHVEFVLSGTVTVENSSIYRGADKSLARAGRKQANVSVRMA